MSSNSLLLCLAFFAALALPALASSSVAEDPRDRTDLDRAAALRRQSSEEHRRIEADRLSGETQCREQILESRCHESLSESLVKRERKVRALENEAGRLERAVKAREVAARNAAREADRPARSAEQAERARRFQVEAGQRELEQSQRQSEHERAIEQGPERARQEQAQRNGRSAAKAERRARDAAAAAERAQKARVDAARYEKKLRQRQQREAAASAPRH